MASHERDYFKHRVVTTKIYPKKVFINQLGYKPTDIKQAVFSAPLEKFWVENSAGEVCFEGRANHFGLDIASQDDVYVADFSALDKAGKYRVKGDNGEESFEFEICEHVYDTLTFDVLKAFYFLRCGIELKPEHAGAYTHAPCHTGKALVWDDRSVSVEVTGGWHDAGDYGRYVTPGATAVAHLLFAYKMYPEVYENLKLNIPESGNGVPDILNEARVELEWILKMQRADGAVYHKATTAQHADFVMPEDDLHQMFVLPVSTMATADLAAVCALASTIYRKFDPEFADRLINAAIKTGEWLEANPEFIGFNNPEGCGTGGYGEWNDRDNRFWAWCELYLATGNEKYHTLMKNAIDEKFPLTALGVGMVTGLGTLSYILSDRADKDLELVEKFKQAFVASAEYLAKVSDNCGYGAAMDEKSYGWGSNMGVGKNGMIFAIADYCENGSRFKEYAHKQLDFLLGVNATGYSMVTGAGEFCVNYPHLRPAHADGIEKCMPGYVSGGPNSHRQDADARRLIPEGTPPMKCFIDEVGSYSVNEITIYWNSPLVFMLGYLN